MGANSFSVVVKGPTARKAFDEAVKNARYEYGHNGYTGTIAEKGSFVMITCPQGRDPQDYADELIEEEDKRIDDKYGPAGCIALGENRWLFFGWASS